MKRYYILVFLVFILLVPLVSSEAERAYPTLPGSISSPSFGYVVHYDDTDPLSADYMPAAQAQFMVDTCNNDDTPSVGNPNGLHVGYTDVGFKAPDFLSSTRNLYTYACTNCDSGCAPSDAILMPASMYDTSGEQCIRSVLGHELFHHVQFAYITFNKWPNWVHPLEGTARMFQDKFYNDLDAWNGAGCCCGYVGEINGYLANPNRTIWDLSYPSVLWWTYLTEQLGTLNAEPNAGADFVVELWERAEANNSPVDVVKAVREAIAAYTTKSMESMFQDFTITNYTKQLDLSLLSSPARYRYRDENDSNGQIYNEVTKTWNGSVPKTDSVKVERWGARYFQADVSSCGDGVVGFHAEGDQASYALIPIKGTDRVQSINKATVANYSRAFLQQSASPYTKLGVVVTGGNSAADFTYTFDCGQVDMEIREPKYPDPIAYVGAYNEPERFLVKVRVQGPASLGTPSVEGLVSDDFTVFVGNHSDPANEAEVINGAYVQGEYWLVVQAPEKESPEPDTYNLTVKLGNIAIASNEAAVVYATKSVDQMLVIDKSGSMDYPTGYSKIDAAKEAGKLFVDSARSSDYTGVVSFSGDLSEPNDDATLEYMLKAVTDDSRLEAKEAIELIKTENMTSIGDGMYLAYDEIVNSGNGRPAPPTERWIVLLSDGMENEAAYWEDIRDYIYNNNIKVNAIALGPMSDQPLMQAIATYTGGRYYYVDLPPTTTSSGSSSIRAAATFPLDLGDAYALTAERIQTHERLWESQGSLFPGETIYLHINIKEESIEDPLFTLSWNGGGMRDYAIFDPDGTSIGDLPDSEINRDEYHATFRLSKLAPGDWTIFLAADTDLAYRATLSGINRYGAQLRLFFGDFGEVYELDTNQFLLNEPVPILASLTDMKGPLLEAHARADVEHPDGSLMSLPLFDDGNHGDGFSGDGIYGGLYYRTTVGSKTSQTDEVYEKRGSYIVTLLAEGKDNIGGEFQRVARGSFSVIEPLEPGGEFQDTDKDGLIDLYENRFPCMAFDIYDSDQDPDLDGAISMDEFYFGTNPCNPDTDNGGENDLSEIKREANPLDGSDDLLPPPIDVGV
ncbi:MAG: VWA domain-containing protein, partial [Anaerolineales bacterium]|nr:VWA domain-containing protein [Anaerolineales bacterium]